MIHPHHTRHPHPARSLRGIASTTAAVSFLACPAVSAATYQLQILPITDTNRSGITNKTSSGYTEAFLTGEVAGTVNYTTTGLSLAYQMVGGAERVVIDNVEDVTGVGIQTDRYISFTLGLDNVDDLAGYIGSYTVDLYEIGRGGLTLEAGGHFEVRTSLDNFAESLAIHNATTQRLDPVASGLTTTTQLIRTNGTVVVTDTPLEVRLYTWYDDEGAVGNLGLGGNDMPFRFRVTTVPEPSAALLLGSAALVFLRRRRA